MAVSTEQIVSGVRVTECHAQVERRPVEEAVQGLGVEVADRVGLGGDLVELMPSIHSVTKTRRLLSPVSTAGTRMNGWPRQNLSTRR